MAHKLVDTSDWIQFVRALRNHARKQIGGVISEEAFTIAEASNLANFLEQHNTPGNRGTPLRRLTDMMWALQNDTDVVIVSALEE